MIGELVIFSYIFFWNFSSYNSTFFPVGFDEFFQYSNKKLCVFRCNVWYELARAKKYLLFGNVTVFMCFGQQQFFFFELGERIKQKRLLACGEVSWFSAKVFLFSFVRFSCLMSFFWHTQIVNVFCHSESCYYGNT